MAPKIKTKKLTDSQAKIVKDLINEFETLNAQENTDQDDLYTYIDNTLDERKRKRDEVDRKNELTWKRHLQFIESIVNDVRPLAKRYRIDIDLPTMLTTSMNVRFKFLYEERPNQWVYKKFQELKFKIYYDEVEGRTLYNDKMAHIQYYTSDHTFVNIDRASLPKLLADQIIQFRKDWGVY